MRLQQLRREQLERQQPGEWWSIGVTECGSEPEFVHIVNKNHRIMTQDFAEGSAKDPVHSAVKNDRRCLR